MRMAFIEAICWASRLIFICFLGNFYIKSENRSSESSLGDSVARLFSPYVNQFVPTATQLTFFYRLADTQLGYLKLNIRLGDAEFEIWRQRGSNNDTWQQGAVSICNAPGMILRLLFTQW